MKLAQVDVSPISSLEQAHDSANNQLWNYVLTFHPYDSSTKYTLAVIPW